MSKPAASCSLSSGAEPAAAAASTAPAPHPGTATFQRTQNYTKAFRGRPSPAPAASSSSGAGLDVVLLVDVSEHMQASALSAARQVALEVLDRLPAGPAARAALLRFADHPEILAPLSSGADAARDAIPGVVAAPGGARVAGALQKVAAEVFVSKASPRKRQVWVITAGVFPSEGQQAAARALKTEYKAAIFGVVCGSKNSTGGVEPIASIGRVYAMEGLDEALAAAFPEASDDAGAVGGALPERYARVTVGRTFTGRPQVRIGQDLHLEVKVENLGVQTIPANSKVVFKENAYFGSLIVPVTRALATGEAAISKGSLQSKGRGSHAALHEYLDLLPEIVEFALVSDANVGIPTQDDAVFLEFQDFTGDIFDWAPPSAHVPRANVLFFGPMGNGKSSFFNSVCTSLCSQVVAPSVVGGTADHVTANFFQFQLDSISELSQLKFAVFDSWGVDDDNYGGDEMKLILHGALPLLFDMNATVTENLVREKTGSPVIYYSPARKVHSVVFIVSGEYVAGEDLERFAALYRKATIELRRKAVVAISYMDRFEGDAVRDDLVRKVSEALRIPRASVYLLENYTADKDKCFRIDKNVYRIAHAALRAASDFIVQDEIAPVPCPYTLDPAYVPPAPRPAPGPDGRAAPVGSLAVESRADIIGQQSSASVARVCPFMSRGGNCPVGSSCPFIHDLKSLPCRRFFGLPEGHPNWCHRRAADCRFSHETCSPEDRIRLQHEARSQGWHIIRPAPAQAGWGSGGRGRGRGRGGARGRASWWAAPSQFEWDPEPEPSEWPAPAFPAAPAPASPAPGASAPRGQLPRDSSRSQPPPDFLCPILHEVMEDPVTLNDGTGMSYERRALQRWLNDNQTSPITRRRIPLPGPVLTPNQSLAAAIAQWRLNLQY
eukprot:tig00001000_g6184.t1